MMAATTSTTANDVLKQRRCRRVDATVLACLSAILLAGCSGLKNATPERPLFSDYKVVFATSPEADASAIQAELEAVVIPQPNNSIFGLRPTVALHNMTGEPKREGKGLRNLLRYKIGSRPVYLENVPVKVTIYFAR